MCCSYTHCQSVRLRATFPKCLIMFISLCIMNVRCEIFRNASTIEKNRWMKMKHRWITGEKEKKNRYKFEQNPPSMVQKKGQCMCSRKPYSWALNEVVSHANLLFLFLMKYLCYLPPSFVAMVGYLERPVELNWVCCMLVFASCISFCNGSIL